MKPPVKPRVVDRDDDLRAVLARAGQANRVAIDVEASGMFAYRALPCTLQLAWDDGAHVIVVDTLAASIALLDDLLGPRGPVKIMHDVAFDARLLAERGIALANVHDTAVAAHMLSRPAIGLASLLEVELGVHIDKAMQQHDWRVRPLDERMLGYLAADVMHLEALETNLWREVIEREIEDAVLEETRYRIASAIAASRPAHVAPAYAKVKGAGRLSERELAALRVAAELRDGEARRRDVPPHKVASADALIAIARARPSTPDELGRILGASATTPDGRDFAAGLLRAIKSAGNVIPEDERALFEVVRMPVPEARLRRQREARLIAWRRDEAKRRGVDEQVVLPGHCLKDAVASGAAHADDLLGVAGIGAFRVRRDGEAIVKALCVEAGDP
jgi:ribonuclease D